MCLIVVVLTTLSQLPYLGHYKTVTPQYTQVHINMYCITMSTQEPDVTLFTVSME